MHKNDQDSAQDSLTNHQVDPARFREGQRITWVSIAVNLVLTVMQVIVGFVANSMALVADAMHTFSDIISDGFVLYANRKSAEKPDADHPYGHGRFETAASLVLGLLLTATGIGILISAADRLQNLHELPPVGVAAIWAAMFTLVAKEGLFRYMLKVAERLRSPMLVANAWHARADALSSLVVAAGIGGALLGFPFADSAAAIVVGGMVIKAGVGFAWEAIRELIDTGLSQEKVAAIRKTLVDTSGVFDLHELRTRRMAHQALVDAHIRVNPRISVSEGHAIAESARQRVLQAHPAVLDVLVHVDAEDDSMPSPQANFPERQALETHLRELLGADAPAFERCVLHYLGEKVEIEVFFPAALAPDILTGIEVRLAERLADDPWVRSVILNVKVCVTHQDGACSAHNAPQ
ncbi:MAG: cation diffusion facilitator family transporter [Gammaproteobacteria bacterium]|nr:cation transporter [Rhodocyclaceae bacterium]MBU3907813.1 cation diffusion facilitator family transporter [Gammaproteobacteria bacterium]MBU3988111.1 cation diffusion facilitator family transporter [Gammaproteobacteria bacterium]MBU4004459.1 cation diffusion facilitator family transporter [Gammaproteobacteria bacterium]MBU4019868.1 cation diffusion facilitator family transporter [Gammaproteobacteria bacterium]